MRGTTECYSEIYSQSRGCKSLVQAMKHGENTPIQDTRERARKRYTEHHAMTCLETRSY